MHGALSAISFSAKRKLNAEKLTAPIALMYPVLLS
jgi:hypothetical protein